MLGELRHSRRRDPRRAESAKKNEICGTPMPHQGHKALQSISEIASNSMNVLGIEKEDLWVQGVRRGYAPRRLRSLILKWAFHQGCGLRPWWPAASSAEQIHTKGPMTECIDPFDG